MENLLQIQEKVRNFILKNSYISEDKVNNDTLIFAQGIMDSMGFVSILGFIEESYSIAANDSELLESNFESIDAISDFVFQKLQSLTNQSLQQTEAI